MRILHVDVNYKHSSTGRIVYELSQAAKAQGHSVFATYGRGQKDDDPDAFKFGYDFETMIHALLTRITGLTAYFSPFSTIRLINKIKKFQPDIVHLHDLHGYFLNIGQLINYLKSTSIRVVWTFHCEFMYTGKCANTKSCNKFESECNECPLLRDYPKTWFFDFTKFMYHQKKNWFNEFNQLSRIITVSDWLKEKVGKSFLNKFKTDVIHNGISTDTFRPIPTTINRPLHQSKDDIIILSVIGNLDDQNKGYHRLKKISELVENSRIRFIVIGNSKKRLLDSNNLFHINKIQDTTILNSYYNNADYFMILSEYESYPTVCLEASATNTPIIGYDVGGVYEASKSVPNYLFSFESNELIEFIEKLDGKKNSSTRDNSFLDNKFMIENYLRLYQEVMN